MIKQYIFYNSIRNIYKNHTLCYNENAGINGENVGVNDDLNNTQKEILKLIIENENITQRDISKKLSKNIRTIEKSIDNLKELGIIEREGSDKTGKWIVKK